jgi:hypothetical protein
MLDGLDLFSLPVQLRPRPHHLRVLVHNQVHRALKGRQVLMELLGHQDLRVRRVRQDHLAVVVVVALTLMAQLIVVLIRKKNHGKYP